MWGVACGDLAGLVGLRISWLEALFCGGMVGIAGLGCRLVWGVACGDLVGLVDLRVSWLEALLFRRNGGRGWCGYRLL